MKLWIVTLCLSIFCILPLRPAYATHGGPHDVTIKVNGLVCDFCARAVEKVFRGQEGVEAVGVDLNTHEITLDLQNGTNIPDDKIIALVTDSGYSVTEIARP
ncbi:MAG: heavy-metal-associated domain-containing protein [Alphaproteobacteria bacterium]|nr:heavy-metal-associated domain-containing protein [Alphaproteobacteria bacterium]